MILSLLLAVYGSLAEVNSEGQYPKVVADMQLGLDGTATQNAVCAGTGWEQDYFQGKQQAVKLRLG